MLRPKQLISTVYHLYLETTNHDEDEFNVILMNKSNNCVCVYNNLKGS